MAGKETNHVTSTKNRGGGGEGEHRGIFGGLGTLGTCGVFVNEGWGTN